MLFRQNYQKGKCKRNGIVPISQNRNQIHNMWFVHITHILWFEGILSPEQYLLHMGITKPISFFFFHEIHRQHINAMLKWCGSLLNLSSSVSSDERRKNATEQRHKKNVIFRPHAVHIEFFSSSFSSLSYFERRWKYCFNVCRHKPSVWLPGSIVIGFHFLLLLSFSFLLFFGSFWPTNKWFSSSLFCSWAEWWLMWTLCISDIAPVKLMIFYSFFTFLLLWF